MRYCIAGSSGQNFWMCIKGGVVQIVGGDFNVDKNDDASFSELIYELDARDIIQDICAATQSNQ